MQRRVNTDDRAKAAIAFWGSSTEMEMSTLELAELIQLFHEKNLGLRNLCIYLVYVVSFLALAFSTAGDPELAGMPGKGLRSTFFEGRWSESGQNELDKLVDVGDANGFYNWLIQVFVPAIWSDTENGTKGETEYYISHLNRVVRSPRIMQIRSNPDSTSCHIFSDKTLATPYPSDKCVDPGGGSYFGFNYVNSDPFGPSYNTSMYTATQGFRYAAVFQLFDEPGPLDCKQCKKCCYRTKTKQDAIRFIQRLNETDWIGPATQWLAIHLDVQNAVTESFSHMRLVFAVEPSGVIESGAFAFLSYNSWYGTIIFSYNTNRFLSAGDFVLLVMEILLAIVTIVAIVRVMSGPVHLIVTQGLFTWWRCSSANVSWDGYDLLTYCTVLVNMVLRFAITAITSPWTKKNNLDDTDPSGYIYTIVPVNHFISAVVILLLTVRTFKFFHLHPRFGFITRTMTFARSELINYFLVFGTIVTGFTVTGWYFWGHGTAAYRGFVESCKSILTFSLGQFSMENLRPVDTSFGLMLFVFYFILLFLVYFVLINIFMAIIINGYNTAVTVQKRQSVRIPPTRQRTLIYSLISNKFPSEYHLLAKMISSNYVDRVLNFPALPVDIFLLPGGRLRILFRVGKSMPCLESTGGRIVFTIRLPSCVPTRKDCRVAKVSFFKRAFSILSCPAHASQHEVALGFPREIVQTWLDTMVIMEIVDVVADTDIQGLLGSFHLQFSSRGLPVISPIRGTMDTGPVQEFVLSRSFEDGELVAKETVRSNELRDLLKDGSFSQWTVEEIVANATRRYYEAEAAVNDLQRKMANGVGDDEELFQCWEELKYATEKVDTLSQKLKGLEETSQI